MKIALLNGWYFFWLALSAGGVVGLYFLLRNKTERTKKVVLFCFLAFGLLLHFLKVFIPPYSTNESVKLSESWFVNICGANIGLFPFLFLTKSKKVKEYMFYIGVISGFLALVYPVEPIQKADQVAEFWDIVRFYYHHWMLLAVPLLMVLLKLHTISYKRVFCAPIGLLLLLLFIMINQTLQSELGFISLRGDDMFNTTYRNNSFIWGPTDDIAKLFTIFCPKFFTIIPVGPYAGQEKYWPWFWLIVPLFVLLTPVAFGLAMIFDHKNFKTDVVNLYKKIKGFIKNKTKKAE